MEGYACTLNSLALVLEKEIADFLFCSIPGMHSGVGVSVGM